MALTEPTTPQDERDEAGTSAPGPIRAAGCLTVAESWLGGFWCLFICVAVIGFGGLQTFAPLDGEIGPLDWGLGWRMLIYVPVVIAELWFFAVLLFTWSDGLHPVGVGLPLDLPVLPWWARPVPALWWAGHFAIGVFASSFYLQMILRADEFNGPLLPIVLVAVLLAFGMSWASNIFLALAVSIIAPRPEVVQAFWRHRLLIDAAVALLVGLILPANL